MNRLWPTFLSVSAVILLVLPIAYAQEVTHARTVEEFFKAHTDLRIAQDAAKTYQATLNTLSLEVIQKASGLTQAEGRSTVLERDITQASDAVFRRAPLDVSELMEKIKLLSIIELAELNNRVKTYGEELLKQKE